MLFIIFTAVGLLALVGAGGLISWQSGRRKSGVVPPSADAPLTLGSLLQRKIDQWYFQFGFFFKQTAHYISYYFLILLHRTVLISRFLLIKVEKRFSKMIDSISGKDTFRKKNAVSVFLTQISESK